MDHFAASFTYTLALYVMNMHSINKKKKNHLGFTLVELAIVMTVAALFAAATIPPLVEDYNRTRTNLLIGEIQALSEAARLWAYDHEYTWPDYTHECKDTIEVLKEYRYLKAMDVVSPWKSRYETSCKIPTQLTIAVASHPKWARIVTNSLPATEPVTLPSFETLPDNGTKTHVYFPGSLPALSQVMHRVHDPSHPELNQMETTLNMTSEAGSPQDIKGANQLNAVNVTAYDEKPDVQNTIKAGNIVDATSYVKALTFIDSNSPDPNNPYVADPVGTTENVSYGISKLNQAKSATPNEYGLTMLSPSNKQNKDPKAYSGSVNLNDIYLRSVHAPGPSDITNPWKWASHIDLVRCNWNGWSSCDGRLHVRILWMKKNLNGILVSPRYYCIQIPGAGFGAIVAAQPGQCKVK